VLADEPLHLLLAEVEHGLVVIHRLARLLHDRQPLLLGSLRRRHVKLRERRED
jgi:hypothetical protein